MLAMGGELLITRCHLSDFLGFHGISRNSGHGGKRKREVTECQRTRSVSWLSGKEIMTGYIGLGSQTECICVAVS